MSDIAAQQKDMMPQDLGTEIESSIRIVKDFPKEGISFYDVNSLTQNPSLWQNIITELAERISSHEIEYIIGIEARGFLLSSALTDRLGLPSSMIRKAGKLPGEVLSEGYDLEYGSDKIEIQLDPNIRNKKVALVDDLYATGGTIQSAFDLTKKAGGNPVMAACIIELEGIPEEFLKPRPNILESIVKLPG